MGEIYFCPSLFEAQYLEDWTIANLKVACYSFSHLFKKKKKEKFQAICFSKIQSESFV